MAKTFKELIVWQEAHQLTLQVYRYTSAFPIEERFGLISQMRRSGVSIASNIAEGFARNGYKDALNFFNTSTASLEELKYQTLLSYDLGYLNQENYEKLSNLEDVVGRLLNGWEKSYRPKST